MKTTLQTLWERDVTQGFQTRTGPRRRTVKTGNRNENRFFKNKESDFLLIPWTPKTGIGPHESVRTVQSNPLANLKIKKKNQKQNF